MVISTGSRELLFQWRDSPAAWWKMHFRVHKVNPTGRTTREGAIARIVESLFCDDAFIVGQGATLDRILATVKDPTFSISDFLLDSRYDSGTDSGRSRISVSKIEHHHSDRYEYCP